MNKKIKKTAIITAIAATTLTAAMISTGCGKVNYTSSKTESNSEITTVKDSQGNEYEVTHTITTENGNRSETYENVPIELYNEAPVDITGLYMVDAAETDWGNNMMVDHDGNQAVLNAEDGHAWGETINYSVDNPEINIKIETEDGNSQEFKNVDLTEAENPEILHFTFSADNGGNGYSCQVK